MHGSYFINDLESTKIKPVFGVFVERKISNPLVAIFNVEMHHWEASQDTFSTPDGYLYPVNLKNIHLKSQAFQADLCLGWHPFQKWNSDKFNFRIFGGIGCIYFNSTISYTDMSDSVRGWSQNKKIVNPNYNKMVTRGGIAFELALPMGAQFNYYISNKLLLGVQAKWTCMGKDYEDLWYLRKNRILSNDQTLQIGLRVGFKINSSE
jgi:hypothetical protein